MVTLYTIHCPSCNVLKAKLDKLGIEYTIVDDQDTIVSVGKQHGIQSAPILQVDATYLKFADAIKWVKEHT